MAIKITPGSIVSDGHVVLTGPITGTVTTDDGTTYDVSDVAVEVAKEHVAEVAHLIGQRYADEGHPTDPDFTYDARNYMAAKRQKKG
jgi:hypothetical protein